MTVMRLPIGDPGRLSSQVDSAFYPPWDGKMSTSQMAVMLCGWEGNRRPGRKAMAAYRRMDDLIHLLADCLWPVHRDQLRAQCSVMSMGSLYLFYW